MTPEPAAQWFVQRFRAFGRRKYTRNTRNKWSWKSYYPVSLRTNPKSYRIQRFCPPPLLTIPTCSRVLDPKSLLWNLGSGPSTLESSVEGWQRRRARSDREGSVGKSAGEGW